MVMMQITDDTPPDLLAGAMNLKVHLPNGTARQMSFERSTPMMDVLVQITNANHLQITAHVLKPIGIVRSENEQPKTLPYTPSTPIGTLDTQEIRVLPKNQKYQRNQLQKKTFETTFRLKVHLPRKQLYVDRVSPNISLQEVMRKMCEEKNLDENKYEFRHPNNVDQVLNLSSSLGDYGINEIIVSPKGSVTTDVFTSSESIMEFRDQKQPNKKNNALGAGLLNFFKRGPKLSRSNTINESGSISSDNGSLSPTQSDDQDKPKVPTRKRRPAPKPPQTSTSSPEKDEGNVLKESANKNFPLTISHSRNSSDSSGYHESSVLSDTGGGTLLRKVPNVKGASNLLSAMKVHSKSASNLSVAGRKKKSAPPPPPVSSNNLRKSATSVALSDPLESSNAENNTSPAPSVVDTVVASPIEDQVELEVFVEKVTETPPIDIPEAAACSVDIVNINSCDEPSITSCDQSWIKGSNTEEDEWQYHLPSPPKAFRDDIALASDLCNEDTNILTSLDLTANAITEKPPSVDSSVSENKTFLGNMSLENLEKRKSLVYNRELTTTFKVDEKSNEGQSRHTEVIDELSKVITSSNCNGLKSCDSNNNGDNNKLNNSSNVLPNFKITTYDDSKQLKKVDIFEDDSIRSSCSMRYQRLNNENDRPRTIDRDFLQRSESVSTSHWFHRSFPIKRSKSQVTLFNSHDRIITPPTSDLESLQILKAIQTKLEKKPSDKSCDPKVTTISTNGTQQIAKEECLNKNYITKIPPETLETKHATQRFIHHTTAAAYKPPKIENSVVARTKFTTNTLPVVRSFELKKTYGSPQELTSSKIYLNGCDSQDSRPIKSRGNAENIKNNRNCFAENSQRENLLKAIRNFGGKEGLKAPK